MDWDLAENIGEELDDVVRKQLINIDHNFYDNYEIEGGYNVIGDDPNFLEAEEIEIYYRIKVKK